MGLQHPYVISQEQLLSHINNHQKSQQHIDAIFNKYAKNQIISHSEFTTMVSRNHDINNQECALSALGLLDEIFCKQNLVQLKSSGIPISFGHSSFQKVLSLMIGIRMSVS